MSKRDSKKVSDEISKLMREFKRSGVIRTSRATYRPKTKKEAVKQAAAIAYGKHGLGRAGKKRKRRRRRRRS